MVKADIAQTGEIASRDRQRVGGGIDRVQMPDARSDERGPAPATATNIGAGALWRQRVPGKYRKIAFEHRAPILGGKIGVRLGKGGPLTAESFYRHSVGIFRKQCHR